MPSRRAVVRGIAAGLVGGGVVGTATAETDDPRSRAAAEPAAGSPTYRYDAGNTGTTTAAGPAEQPSVVWRRQFRHPTFAPPAVGRETVFQPTVAGRVVALSAVDGTPRWRASVPGGLVTTPALSTAGLLLANENREVQSLSVTDGSQQWGVGDIARGGGACAPVLADGLVYTGGADGLVHGFDRGTGTAHWELRLPEAVLSSLAVADGRLFVAAGRRVYAVDASRVPDAAATPAGVAAATREPVWSRGFDSEIRTAVVARDGRVVVATETGVTALAAADGEPSWSLSTVAPVRAAPAVGADRLVVSTVAGDLVGVGTDGTEQWRTSVGVTVDTPPVVAGGRCYAQRRDGTVFALDPATGAVLWQYDHGGVGPTAPVAVDGRLYLTDWDGSLTVLA